jgi:hypothetical protein
MGNEDYQQQQRKVARLFGVYKERRKVSQAVEKELNESPLKRKAEKADRDAVNALLEYHEATVVLKSLAIKDKEGETTQAIHSATLKNPIH